MTEPTFASLNPEEFASGLPDNFVGTIKRSRYKPWHFPKSTTNKYMLFAGWTIEPDEDSGYKPFTENYRAGFLNSTWPTNDGIEPAGANREAYALLATGQESIAEEDLAEFEGVYAMGQNPGKNTEWAQCLRALLLCGYELTGVNLDQFEGLRCRFNRVTSENQPPETEGQPKREFKVLVPTEIVEDTRQKSAKKTTTTVKPSAAKSTASSTAKPTAKPATAATSDGFDEEVASAALSVVAERGSIRKGDLLLAVRNSFTDKEQGKLALQTMAKPGFLEAIDGITVSGQDITLG